jgi:hypothetical protein
MIARQVYLDAHQITVTFLKGRKDTWQGNTLAYARQLYEQFVTTGLANGFRIKHVELRSPIRDGSTLIASKTL